MKSDSFGFRVFTRRWGHHDTYQVKLSAAGWHITHIATSGDCQPDGVPHLFTILDKDGVRYAKTKLMKKMALLWAQIQSKKMGKRAIQTKLDQIAKWVSATEVEDF